MDKLILSSYHNVVSTLIVEKLDRKMPKHRMKRCIRLKGVFVAHWVSILIVLLLHPIFDWRCFKLRFGLAQYDYFDVFSSSDFASTCLGLSNPTSKQNLICLLQLQFWKTWQTSCRNTWIGFGHSFSKKLDFWTVKYFFHRKSNAFSPLLIIQ